MEGKKTICLDFDGVIHRYGSGWNDGVVDDIPMPGIEAAITTLRKHFRVVVCTARRDIRPAADWMERHGIFVDELTNVKPIASVYVDDRGMRFEGSSWTQSHLQEIYRLAELPASNR